MNPTTFKKRWAIVGTAAVLGVSGAGIAAALNDPVPAEDASAAVVLNADDDGGAEKVAPDDSPESADSPNESARDTAGSARSADSPDDSNYVDPSPKSADSANDSPVAAPATVSADSPNEPANDSPQAAPATVQFAGSPASADSAPAASAASADSASADSAD